MASIYERAEAVRAKAAGMLQLAMAVGPTPESIARVSTRMAVRIDAEAEEFSATERQDCRKGCNYCCHRMIFASVPEVLAVIGELDAWPSGDRTRLSERLEFHNSLASSHRSEGFLRFREPCPFLLDGDCSIYAVRPYMCRTTVSVEAGLCKIQREDVDSGVVRKENREPRLSAAVSEAFGGLLEFPTVVGALLKEPNRIEGLVKSSESFKIHVEAEGARDIAAPKPDPLTKIEWNSEQVELFRNQRIADVNVLVSRLNNDIFLKTEMPTIYQSEEHMAESLHRWLNAIEVLSSGSIKDPTRAYFELAGLRPVKAAYQTFDIRPSLEQLGRLLTEQIAKKMAPELCGPLGARKPGRLRIGFVGKIGATSGSRWSLGWFENMNRRDFESTLINVDPYPPTTGLTYTFKDAADHYYHLKGHPLEIARFIRKLDLDYLIFADIGDNAALYQQAIFRLARRQALSWGTPMTSGLPTIDDYLSSELGEPSNAAEHYTETLVRLPGTGCTLRRPRPDALGWTRERAGLPSGFLACYPQVLIKWLPTRDAILGRLTQIADATIVLFDSLTPYERQIVDARAKRVGARIHWLPFCPAPMFHQILSLCDIGLDGLDWSGGLTVMESLEAGLPFVSHEGPYFRQRLATSTLSTVGAQNFIAHDPDEYLSLATSEEIREARVRNLNIDALYEDLRPIRALEDHVRDTSVNS